MTKIRQTMRAYILSETADHHLFWFQMAMGVLFIVFQLGHMIHAMDTQGVSMALFGSVIIFLVANILLTYNGYKQSHSIRMLRALWVYIMWLIVHMVLIVGLIWIRIATSIPLLYPSDMQTILLVVLGYGLIAGILWIQSFTIKISYTDPMIKGLVGVVAKSVPQFVMAISIFMAGGSGHAAFAIIAANLTPLARITQLYLNPLHDGNRKWLLISETCNETTWALVSFAWLVT